MSKKTENKKLQKKQQKTKKKTKKKQKQKQKQKKTNEYFTWSVQITHTADSGNQQRDIYTLSPGNKKTR